MKGYKKKIGAWGEDLAKNFLEEKGYVFVSRNWRTKRGEIDLIMKNGEETVFVEVKTRATPFFGGGEEAVNTAKKEKIKRAIEGYCTFSKEKDVIPRFDIVVTEIYGLTPRFIHYENVEL